MSSLGWTSRRHTDSSLIVIVGELLPTHHMVIVLYFKGIRTMLYPKSCMTLDGTGSRWVG